MTPGNLAKINKDYGCNCIIMILNTAIPFFFSVYKWFELTRNMNVIVIVDCFTLKETKSEKEKVFFFYLDNSNFTVFSREKLYLNIN